MLTWQLKLQSNFFIRHRFCSPYWFRVWIARFTKTISRDICTHGLFCADSMMMSILIHNGIEHRRCGSNNFSIFGNPQRSKRLKLLKLQWKNLQNLQMFFKWKLIFNDRLVKLSRFALWSVGNGNVCIHVSYEMWRENNLRRMIWNWVTALYFCLEILNFNLHELFYT